MEEPSWWDEDLENDNQDPLSDYTDEAKDKFDDPEDQLEYIVEKVVENDNDYSSASYIIAEMPDEQYAISIIIEKE